MQLKESKTEAIPLSRDDAAGLNELGRRLAARASRTPRDSSRAASMISCTPRVDGLWDVCVANAIGIIGIGDTRIAVEPKIPVEHLTFLLAESSFLPRIDATRAPVGPGSFWQMLVHWFLLAAERLIQAGIIHDYAEVEDELPVLRGRVDIAETAMRYYRGRVAFACTYDEYTLDTPLNRVIKAAARRIRTVPLLSGVLRRRAYAVEATLEQIGPLRPTDLNVLLERRSRHYSDALSFARFILDADTHSIASGDTRGWSFLIRTPHYVERALFSLLNRSVPGGVLRNPVRVRSTSGYLPLNPDIVFKSFAALADVKYKIGDGGWLRDDLYEVVAFAAGARLANAAVFSFSDNQQGAAPDVRFGDIEVRNICWNSGPHVEPELAAHRFISEVNQWLISVPFMEGANHVTSQSA